MKKFDKLTTDWIAFLDYLAMDVFRVMGLFVRVVDTGSLTAAAAERDLSPTMVGNHLQALEDRLGTRLLNRTTRRQSLTEFGRVYYDRCVEILGLVGDAEALALESQTAPKGRLRITASATFGVERLTPVLAGMGIVMLPEIMLSEDVESGRLVCLLPDYTPPTRPLNLLYVRDRRMSPKLRSFVDFVVDRFSAQS